MSRRYGGKITTARVAQRKYWTRWSPPSTAEAERLIKRATKRNELKWSERQS